MPSPTRLPNQSWHCSKSWLPPRRHRRHKHSSRSCPNPVGWDGPWLFGLAWPSDTGPQTAAQPVWWTWSVTKTSQSAPSWSSQGHHASKLPRASVAGASAQHWKRYGPICGHVGGLQSTPGFHDWYLEWCSGARWFSPHQRPTCWGTPASRGTRPQLFEVAVQGSIPWHELLDQHEASWSKKTAVTSAKGSEVDVRLLAEKAACSSNCSSLRRHSCVP